MGPAHRFISPRFNACQGSERRIVVNQMFCHRCKQMVRSPSEGGDAQTCGCQNVSIGGGEHELTGIINDYSLAEECSVFVFVPTQTDRA